MNDVGRSGYAGLGALREQLHGRGITSTWGESDDALVLRVYGQCPDVLNPLADACRYGRQHRRPSVTRVMRPEVESFIQVEVDFGQAGKHGSSRAKFAALRPRCRRLGAGNLFESRRSSKSSFGAHRNCVIPCRR